MRRDTLTIMKHDALQHLLAEHLDARPISARAAARLAQARQAALARHAQRSRRRVHAPQWLGRWWVTHMTAARRGVWAMAMAITLSVSYLGWMAWSMPSDADIDIALLTSDLPVEAYLHPNFTADL